MDDEEEEYEQVSICRRMYKKASDMGLIRVTVWIVTTVIYTVVGALCYQLIEGVCVCVCVCVCCNQFQLASWYMIVEIKNG
jgi:hypothetical protein